MPYRRYVTISVVILMLWPTLGWLWLHQQGDRIAGNTAAWFSDHITQHLGTAWQSTEFVYQPGILPRLSLQNASFLLHGTSEPLSLTNATLRPRWYSPWVFQWLPQRLDIHQASLLLPVAQDSQLTEAELWVLLDQLPKLQPFFQTLPSLDVQQLKLTLYDPTTVDVADVTIQALLRRNKDQDYTLSLVADLQGDGWVEHGFGEIQSEWQLLPAASSEGSSATASINIQRLSAQLEVHSSTRTYGIYRWDTFIEQFKGNPQTRTFTAKEFATSQGATEGRDPTVPHEIGERAVWQGMTGGVNPQDWSAEILRRAHVVRPQSTWVTDLIWTLQYEQWSNTPESNQSIGRTEVGWQATVNHPLLSRVLVQLHTPAHSDRLSAVPTLTRWQADGANVAIDIKTPQRNYVLRGQANALSDLDQHQLQLHNLALEEVAGQDAYWLYGHLNAIPEGLSMDDLIGPERGIQANPFVDFSTWANCIDPTESVMVIQILRCAEQHRATLNATSWEQAL